MAEGSSSAAPVISPSPSARPMLRRRSLIQGFVDDAAELLNGLPVLFDGFALVRDCLRESRAIVAAERLTTFLVCFCKRLAGAPVQLGGFLELTIGIVAHTCNDVHNVFRGRTASVDLLRLRDYRLGRGYPGGNYPFPGRGPRFRRWLEVAEPV